MALAAVKDDLSRVLRLAEREEIVITRHGKAAGLLVGFADEDDWLEYRLERDPRFLSRIARARESLRAGRGVRLEDVGEPVSRRRRARGGAPATGRGGGGAPATARGPSRS